MLTKTIFKVKILLLIATSCINTVAENKYQWWEKRHGLNQNVALSKIKRAPYYLGPNALPVPESYDAIIPYRTSIVAGARYQFAKNETTFNPEAQLVFPIQKNRMMFGFQTRFFEWYETDTLTRDNRFMRDSISKGISQSESFLYFRGKVWQNFYFFPDFTITFGLKMNTGKNLENARHTNAPGYWFSGDFGKKILLINQTKIRAFTRLGGFIWQTSDNEQNDAWLYALGLSISNQNYKADISIDGFSGYKNDGDRPVVLSVNFNKNMPNGFFTLQYRRGLRHFIQNGFMLGYGFHINYIDRKNPY